MTATMLDASALVAWVFDEPGGRVIETILESGEATTTPLAVAELLTVCRRKRLPMEDLELRELLATFDLRIEPVLDEDVDTIVRHLAAGDAARAAHAKVGSLSLADATLLAVAKRLGVPAVVSDRFWDRLDVDVEVLQFR